ESAARSRLCARLDRALAVDPLSTGGHGRMARARAASRARARRAVAREHLAAWRLGGRSVAARAARRAARARAAVEAARDLDGHLHGACRGAQALSGPSRDPGADRSVV